MLTDECIEELTQAAETIYRYCDKDKGFPSGIWTAANGKTGKAWNSFTGAKEELEKQLDRKLSKAEVTILSLAIGYGPTPMLTVGMRDEAFDNLWGRIPKDQRGRMGVYVKMMNVLCSFY